MRIRKEAWHRSFCDGNCDKHYCKHHRLIFFDCHSAKVFKEFDERGNYSEIDGGGECLDCRHESEFRKIKRLMDYKENQNARRV